MPDTFMFGPVAIFKTFNTLEEAASLANETSFGLGASVWGSHESASKIIPDNRIIFHNVKAHCYNEI